MTEITREERQREDQAILQQFPILDGSFTYLDNGATTQKPQCVLDAMMHYYMKENANPMRGLYDLSIKATEAYEDARETVRAFINARSHEEIVFTRNATESLNLVAYTYGRAFIKEGDEIVITIMEHHSNMLPWQQLCKEKGAKLTYILPEADGTITEEMFRSYMNPNVKLVAMTQVSNVLGVKNDIKTFARIAHENGAVFVCDGAQSIPHMKVDVQDLDCDFLSFSGHKIYGPMGIGVLYGKRDLLDKMPPFLFGGEAESWDELKQKEKGQKTTGEAMAGVARSLPATWRAEKIQKKAAKTGFCWESADEALDKLAEETGELREAVRDHTNIDEELGDVLFAAVRVASTLERDPEQALHAACEKFIRRFTAMEQTALAEGRPLETLSKDELLAGWNAQKRVVPGGEQ